MLIVFQRGIWRVPNSMVSVTKRMDGSGGKRNSFCALYSLRISFCSVPPSLAIGKPRFAALTIYIAQMTEAGLLIVIEVVIVSSRQPAKSISMSEREQRATTHVTNSL